MTIQVGMVANDGVLLASDLRWTDETGRVREPWNSPKIKVNQECGIAVSSAGRMMLADRLANELIAYTLQNENWLATDLAAIPNIAEELTPYVQPNERCQCLAVFTRPTVQLWHFQIVRITKSNGKNDWDLKADQMTDFVFAGDYKNSAMFWVERYYPRTPKVTMKALVPLAAHLITAAHLLNTAGIQGLEIVLCNRDEINRITDTEIEALEMQASERDKSIGKSLLGNSQQFTYAPNVIGQSRFHSGRNAKG